ncbi:hypothetical protein EV175_003082 [Coemansia sp. RSA 1933]|nr:hypothetical protein EV175_003082 [Coemansia sp. RSA 1933]
MLRHLKGLFITAVALLCLATHTECSPVGLSKRTVGRSDMLNYHGAVLVKNGIETSCDIALIDNKAAFVAASCIAMKSGAVDTSVQHDVYFDQYGSNSPAKTPVSSSDIHIHPSYDEDTLANNIAVMEFDFTDQGSWTNSIAVYPTEWSDWIFVRRQLNDASSSTWSLPQVKSNTYNKNTCATVSGIFGSNADGMRCNDNQVNSIWDTSCPFPYGAVYGQVSNTIAIGGLHSYTFMPTSDYCNGDRGNYYFTLLYNYIEWGESVIGRSISTLVGDTSAYDSTSKSTSYSMTDNSEYNPKDWYFFSSNMRFPTLWNPDNPDTQYLKSSSSSSSSNSNNNSNTNSNDGNGSSSSSSSGSGSSSATNGNNNHNNNNSTNDDGNSALVSGNINTDKDVDDSDEYDALVSGEDATIHTGNAGSVHSSKSYDGLSKGAIIAIAVSVPLGAIILAIISFLIYKKRRSWEGHVAHGWGKFGVKSQNSADDLVGELGGASQHDNNHLPSYDELHMSLQDGGGMVRASYLQSPNTTAFEKHGSSDLLNYHGAVLVKNGIETSCDIALIDNKAGFVAASCIEIINGAIDGSVQHAVYFDQYGNNSPAKASVAASDIHIHPSYDENTLANNIAIVEFDFTAQGNWTNSIAVYPTEWTDIVFVRRELIEARNSTWGSPVVKSNMYNKNTCATISGIFDINVNYMFCNDIEISSVWDSSCPFPYGAVYGEVANTTLAISGLHSYTFMPTSDYCNGDRGLYYFTMLYGFIEWGESVIGRSISTLVGDTSAYDAISQSTEFSLNATSEINPDNWYLFSSNMRFPTPWSATDPDTEYLSSFVSSDDDGASGGATDGAVTPDGQSIPGMTNEEGTYNGLSKSATIAIAVCVPVGVIIIAVISFLVYKRRHRLEGHIPGNWRRARVKSQVAVDELIEQIGGAQGHETLPAYRELHDSFRISNGATRESYLHTPDTLTFEKNG